MSGGTYYSARFDMSLANACLCDMMEQSNMYNINDFIDFEDKYVTHVEKAVKLEGKYGTKER